MQLEIKNLRKEFKNNVVLNDVNLTLDGGKIYGFIGRNGSGKSVLLKIICGFYAPTSGSITLNGKDYISSNEFPDDTRALIEKPKFLPDLTGYENLKLLASVQNKIGANEIEKVLDELNIKQEANKRFSKYSLGTKQKFGIAQVLMEDPKMIILDEPFNGVENETADRIRNLLKREKRKNKIIIIASHIKDDIYGLADTIFEVDGGNIKELKNNRGN